MFSYDKHVDTSLVTPGFSGVFITETICLVL